MPVPLQLSPEGCYIKVTFPVDFSFDQATFTDFTASVGTPNRVPNPPTFHNLVQPADPAGTDFAARQFVFQGC